ncbi:hypothetical protein [Streptomyces sp. NPDC102360]
MIALADGIPWWATMPHDEGMVVAIIASAITVGFAVYLFRGRK